MLAEMEKLLPAKLNRVVATSLAGCIHCGMCSDACHYSVSIPEDKTLVPRVQGRQISQMVQEPVTTGWAEVFPSFVGAQPLTKELAEEMYDKLSAAAQCVAVHLQLPDGSGLWHDGAGC